MRYCFHSANNKTRKQRKAAASMDHSSVVSSPSDKTSTTSGKKRGGSMYVRSRYVRFEYGRLIEWLANDDDENITMERKLLMMWKESDKRGNARNHPKQ